MSMQTASSRGGTYNRSGVVYSDHNGRDVGRMPQRLRLRAVADHLAEACSLTSTAERALYLRLRREWAVIEAMARAAEAAEREQLSAATPVLFPTGGPS